MKIVKQNLVIQGNDMGRPWETAMSIYRTTSPVKSLDRMGRISKGFWTYSVIHNKLLLDALETEAEKNIIDPITASLANAVPAPLCAHTSMYVRGRLCMCVWVHVYICAHGGQSSTLKEPPFLFLQIRSLIDPGLTH